MKLKLKLAVGIVTCLMLQQSCFAHFPWLIVNDKGKIALFFGEGVTDRTYKLPESILDAKVYTGVGEQRTLIELDQVATEEFVGLVSKASAKGDGLYSTDVTFGIYHGNLLNYSASHFHGKLPTARSKSSGEKLVGLAAQAIDSDGGVDVFVTLDGKPLQDLEVHLYCEEGHEEATAKTDEFGKVSFSDKEVEDGLNAIMFGHTLEGQDGKLGEESYTSTMHYCTMTFVDPEEETGKSVVNELTFADLPFEVTSFGAARVGGTAYVYGGHNGDAHSYSTEEQSNQLLSLDLEDPSADWKVAAEGDRLQGLAMVPYKSSVIILGGFSAKNDKGEEHDLHSQSRVRMFDAVAKQWKDLPPLPAGRSSHDAAILDGTIYVVGGWTMAGEKDTVWHTTALKLNVEAEAPAWEEIATPPFERRALATVAHDGKIFVVGGMDKNGGPTKDVQVYDPKANKWTEGPDLIGKGRMAGFGAAGWSVGGQLVISTYEGDILILDGKTWKTLGKSEDSRFFHRLIPIGNNKLVAVGGANMESGKFLNLEILAIE